MEIKVLQGVNLENKITTIKITTDSQPKTELLDMIKGFHRIFMTEYKIEGNTISIQSKLPHLWKEAAPALNKLSTGEWTEDQTKSYLLEEVIKKQVSSMSTIPVLDAAMELGYEVQQMFIAEGLWTTETSFNRRYAIGIGQEIMEAASASTSGDSYMAFKLQRDKFLTNTTITRMGLPIAKWAVVESEDHLEKLLTEFKMPVVIKPVGLTGGSGVTTKIFNIDQARTAFQYAQKMINEKERQEWQRKIMIQEQVSGEDYRILVINGELKIATKRIPAFVIGDGQRTIAQLIEEVNKDPRRNISDPTHTLKPIVIDEMMHTFLAEQNLNVDHVPAKDEQVYVRKVASMSQGGVTEDFTDKVHPQIRYVVESIARTVKAYVLGVDVICKDITAPLTIDNGSLIEMNTMPEAYLNSFPVYGQQYPQIGEWIINGMMKGKQRTKSVVVVGKPLKEVNEILTSNGINLSTNRIGIHSEGSIFINGEEVNSGLEIWRAIEAIKLNASLDVIVLHYPNLDQVREFGYGFDRIDILVE